MAPRKALAVFAVVLVLVLVPQHSFGAEPSTDRVIGLETTGTKETRDGGLIISIVGIAIGTFLAWAGIGGQNVVAGPITIDVDTTHLHVSDTRTLMIDFPFATGNINVWDSDPAMGVVAYVDDAVVVAKIYSRSGAEQSISRHSVPIEAGDIGTATIKVIAWVRGEDHGLVKDTVVTRTQSKVKQIGVVSPVGPLSLSPPAGETFDHGLGVTHSLTLENYAAKEVWVIQSNVNGTTQSVGIALPGQDFGPPMTTQLMYGGVNHTGSHAQQTEPIGFLWGSSELKLQLAKRLWKQNTTLNNGTDFCLLEGESSVDAPTNPREVPVSPRISSGCFRPGLLQLSEIAHGFGLSDITVSLVNHPGVGPVHDLTTDATGQFCWSNLNLAEFVDVHVNSDGNKPELEQHVFERIPLASLEGGEPTLVMNYVEWLVPPIMGTLEVSDGRELHAFVYSRRPGYPDHLIGLVSDGAFSIEGHYMLEFNSFSSELVFVPEPPFNRTLSPATPVVVPFDPTFFESIDIGTVTFTIAPRETSPTITMRGTFLNEDLLPVPGLELEFHNGATLITAAATDATGFFEVTVPNGVATVSAPNLEVLDLEPLPAEDVDFGLNGMTLLDIGNRRLFWDSSVFADNFETGDTTAWASVIP